MRRSLAAIILSLPIVYSPVLAQQPPAQPADPKPPEVRLPARWPVPEDIHGEKGRAYTVFVEAMPGADWDEKIKNAIERALTGGVGAEVILPPQHITIKKPIRLWRQRKTKNEDTTAEGIELADIRNVFAAIKGGRPQHLAKGIIFRGATAGSTRLIWEGGPNQVVIDIPAPWYVRVSNLLIDGNNAEGLIGIRYRAGWEFGTNGGKWNLFEHISLERLDVGIHIGDPFAPDLVGSTFRQVGVHAARVGFRLESANVAEMWFKECYVGSCEEAGFKLIGHSGRVLRSIKEKDAPTQENVLRDADGREIFLEQLPPTLVQQQVNREAHDDVAGSKKRPWVGGGAPTCFISDLVAHMQYPQAWMIDTNWASVRLEHVRMEGCSGILRATGKGMRNTRFNDILIDVNAVTTGGLNGYAIEYHKGGPIYFIGGTFEGPIGLGQNAICYSVGARFLNRGRPMPGYIREGADLPEGGHFQRTGEATTIPNRRWKGEKVASKVHDRIGFVQLPGTSGARVHEMSEGHQMTVPVTARRKQVTVELKDLARQPDAAYGVFVTPTWNAGAVWVRDKQPDRFTVDYDKPPAEAATLDILIRRQGFQGELTPE
ncbi:MAG: hypothetical protein AB1696_12695 [Planctomycetota bacterium]